MRIIPRRKRIMILRRATWLKLEGGDIGAPVLYIAVFDKHRKYSIYLGELRLSIVELLKTDENILIERIPEKWYQLHSSSSERAFVTGSIKVGFELSSRGPIEEYFARWESTLVDGRKSVKLNDQDYYSDTETDVESLMIGDERFENTDNISSLSVNDSQDIQMIKSSNFAEPPKTILESSSEVSFSDSSLQVHGAMNTTTLENQQKVNHTSGVVYLRILSAEDLPPFKRFIQKGFDMDPFVVISCGKKTFRTSWRRHTLKPIFNETLAFELLTHEENFDIVFNIYDKDNISFNDKVAFGSIPIHDILDKKEFFDYNLSLKLFKNLEYSPKLKFQVKFEPYQELKNHLLQKILYKYGETLDIIQLGLFLEELNIDEDLNTFFTLNNKKLEDSLAISEIVPILAKKYRNELKLERCPICLKTKQIDMVTHVAICSIKGDRLKSFATAGFASKRWYSKVLIKFVYGKYALGKNNANILVQDRLTGFIIEEKMSLYIRLGIRLLYKGTGVETRKIKAALKSLSIKQGARYDSSISVKEIESFVKFHQLDLSECEEVKYNTFNEFFYRKLKKGSRPAESPDSKVITSPADSRCTAFNNISRAKEIWIKSRSFSVEKLLGKNIYSENFENCSLAIFRLAPQDYHRFHSPVDGIIGEPVYISGEYYTVNPMAVRSDLDVFGENVRVIIPIETQEFGLMYVVSVGAMLVGSTVLSVKKGDAVKRTDEIGYFKFGGSTIITLFQSNAMQFDGDLVHNSNDCIETLVRVGMSVGHALDIDEFKRKRENFNGESDELKLKIIRTITGGGGDHPWEFYNMNVDLDEELSDFEEDEDDEDEDEYNEVNE
ncbi:hypothetical protein WICMUC_000703 [Wickerhamomyces mucosus]|uniref:Phosphatidylserine decarboxylase proenzyme 2 n=1 Tax=Wickerhamomyces mucosus TaxID=1378264 RepID=A0A9P8PYJ6_9ASCO|nr:hypothetical protein WICMUC_000703 [Wickerhamomyces mucosus]